MGGGGNREACFKHLALAGIRLVWCNEYIRGLWGGVGGGGAGGCPVLVAQW